MGMAWAWHSSKNKNKKQVTKTKALHMSCISYVHVRCVHQQRIVNRLSCSLMYNCSVLFSIGYWLVLCQVYRYTGPHIQPPLQLYRHHVQTSQQMLSNQLQDQIFLLLRQRIAGFRIFNSLRIHAYPQGNPSGGHMIDQMQQFFFGQVQPQRVLVQDGNGLHEGRDFLVGQRFDSGILKVSQYRIVHPC
jgi:hypothetical protein